MYFVVLLLLVRRTSATSPPQSPGYGREYEEGTFIIYSPSNVLMTDEILNINSIQNYTLFSF